LLAKQRSFIRRIQVLTEEGQIVLRSDLERQAFAMMKNLAFEHTCVFNEELLVKTGMHREFESVFALLAGQTFGKFQSQLQNSSPLNSSVHLSLPTQASISACFNEEFYYTWRMLSNTLGFNKKCSLDAHGCLPNFSQNNF
jgi:hypothetical protein